MIIPDEELQVEAIWDDRRGGQHVGTASVTIRMTHIPSGTVAQVRNRSQHQARRIAHDMILTALTDRRFEG